MFDNDYVVKNLKAMIIDESNRIVSLGLAKGHDISKLVGVIQGKRLTGEQNFGAIARLHAQLSVVRLPGDFEKMAADFYQVPKNFLGYSGEEFCIFPDKKDELKKEHEEDPELIIFEEEPEEEDEALDQMALAAEVSDQLEVIAYKLGSRGDHESAYLVERNIRDIQQLATRGKLLPRK